MKLNSMARIHAGVSELKASHFRLVAAAAKGEGPPAHLLLFYAAECGLKFVHLRRNKLKSTEKLEDVDHDLISLIKNLRLSASAIGGAPTLRLNRSGNESCSVSSSHQAWRYGVQINADDEGRFVTWLQKICDVVIPEYL